jgi:hypothetical protein
MSHETSTSETIVALYLALQLRDSCESCNGSGVNWVGTGETGYAGLQEVNAEPCECAETAWYVLEKYKQKFDNGIILYCAQRSIVPTDENTQPKALMNELFRNVR